LPALGYAGKNAPSTAIGNEAGSTGATGAIGLIKIRLWCSCISL